MAQKADRGIERVGKRLHGTTRNWMRTRTLRRDDGRYLIYYTFTNTAGQGSASKGNLQKNV